MKRHNYSPHFLFHFNFCIDFLRKLKKVKKSNGRMLVINEVCILFCPVYINSDCSSRFQISYISSFRVFVFFIIKFEIFLLLDLFSLFFLVKFEFIFFTWQGWKFVFNFFSLKFEFTLEWVIVVQLDIKTCMNIITLYLNRLASYGVHAICYFLWDSP